MFVIPTIEVKDDSIRIAINKSNGAVFDDDSYSTNEDVKRLISDLSKRDDKLMKSFRESMKFLYRGIFDDRTKLLFLATMWTPTSKTNILIKKVLSATDLTNNSLKDCYECLFEHNSLTFEDFTKIFTSDDINEMKQKIITKLSNKYGKTFNDYYKVYSSLLPDDYDRSIAISAISFHHAVFKYFNNVLETNIKLLLNMNYCNFNNVMLIKLHINTMFKEFCNKDLLDNDIFINFNMLTLIEKPPIKYEYYNQMLLNFMLLLLSNAKIIDNSFKHIPKNNELINFDL